MKFIRGWVELLQLVLPKGERKMKNIFLLALLISLDAFAHSAQNKDMEGAWFLVESKWNTELMQLCKPEMTKIYSQGVVLYTWYEATESNACNKLSIGQGTYTLTDGIVTETITNHSNKNLIGESFTYKPNFMFDKKSFVQEVNFGEDVLFERWANKSCDQEKCARIN